jgi:excisionase family DNA binding protein
MEIVKRGLTIAEACEYLGGISRPSLYRIMKCGELTCYRIGTRVYLTRESLDQYIDARIGLLQDK